VLRRFSAERSAAAESALSHAAARFGGAATDATATSVIFRATAVYFPLSLQLR